MVQSDNSGPNMVEELLWVVPRLWERTARQLELTRSLVGNAPCVGSLLGRGSRANQSADLSGETDVLEVIADLDEMTATGPAEAVESARADPAEAPDHPVSPSANGHSGSRPVPAGTGTPSADTQGGSGPGESDLAIPEYDSLAASQVIPRLEMLDAMDLGLILDYEEHHRNRQTIVHKVRSLLAVSSN